MQREGSFSTLNEWGAGQQALETTLIQNATVWKWIDDNSPVTEISLDGFCKVCHHLDITHIFIVGDSLQAITQIAPWPSSWIYKCKQIEKRIH